jgi:hypothetical protein
LANPKQKAVTIQGVEFTFQHPGVRKSLQINDSSRDKHGNLMSEAYYAQLMEHVIVQPRTNWEYWDEHTELLEEVMTEAVRFLVGAK